MEVADAFEKKIGTEIGRHYHVIKATGEFVWNVPSGVSVPLDGPSEETRIRAALVHGVWQENKERTRQERLSIADALKKKSLKA